MAELRKEGVQNPTAHDAGQWIDSAFGYAPNGLKYKEDWYEDRIRNIHPESRFGSEAVPFFCVDDIIHLNIALKDIFFYLITKEKCRETLEEMARWRR